MTTEIIVFVMICFIIAMLYIILIDRYHTKENKKLQEQINQLKKKISKYKLEK